MNSKAQKFNKLAIFTIAILLVLAIVINISSAYFTDSAKASSKSGDIKFGTIAVKVSVAGATYVEEDGKVKFSLTADEVAQGVVYKTLVVENKDGKQTEDFALRLKTSSNSSKISVNISSIATSYASSKDFVSSNWVTGSDQKSYFNKFISLPESKKIYIPVVIDMSSLSSSDFATSLYVSIDWDIIQRANGGYESWTTRPTSLKLTQVYTPSN